MPANTPRLAQIWRHPVKGLGGERLTRVTLAPGTTLPGDRLWAVAHEGSRYDPRAPGWAPCGGFLRATRAPALVTTRVSLDEASGRLALAHPRRPTLALDPEAPDALARLVGWLGDLWPDEAPRPVALARVPGRGMTDTDYPSLSLLSLASLRALSQRMGVPLDPRRFRGNLWLDGLAPWAEFDLVGRELTIGGARLRVVEPITRCAVTRSNPETGRPDVDTLAALSAHCGHRCFGVYCEVIEGGAVDEGDPMVAP